MSGQFWSGEGVRVLGKARAHQAWRCRSGKLQFPESPTGIVPNQNQLQFPESLELAYVPTTCRCQILFVKSVSQLWPDEFLKGPHPNSSIEVVRLGLIVLLPLSAGL